MISALFVKAANLLHFNQSLHLMVHLPKKISDSIVSYDDRELSHPCVCKEKWESG